MKRTIVFALVVLVGLILIMPAVLFVGIQTDLIGWWDFHPNADMKINKLNGHIYEWDSDREGYVRVDHPEKAGKVRDRKDSSRSLIDFRPVKRVPPEELKQESQ